MRFLIKNLGIIICCLFNYKKISQAQMDKHKIFEYIFFTICIGCVVAMLENKKIYITIPLLFVSIYLFIFFIVEKKRNASFVKYVVSFAISYVLLIISIILTIMLMFPFFQIDYNKYIQYISFVIQMLIMNVPYIFKRTRKGMPFLDKQIYSIPGVVISMCIIMLASLLDSGKNDIQFIITSMLFFFFAILIFIYWRNAITRSYIERLNVRNFRSLNDELKEKDAYIAKLEEDNKRLSKIVHKDNKLVTAMEMAVEQYLVEVLNYKTMSGRFVDGTDVGRSDVARTDIAIYRESVIADELAVTEESEPDNKSREFTERGKALLEELRKLAEERGGIITDTEKHHEVIPESGIGRVDHLLKFLQEKALKSDITFHVTMDCRVADIVPTQIDEESFCTLLADIVDNAIIATHANKGRRILLNVGMIKKYYAIHVYDSGIDFTREVLAGYGVEQLTTHGQEGGSGIGLMQTAEIMDKCNGSIFIDEFSQDGGLYTKRFSVIFNRKHQYILYTKRSDEDISYLRKRADIMVVKK